MVDARAVLRARLLAGVDRGRRPSRPRSAAPARGDRPGVPVHACTRRCPALRTRRCTRRCRPPTDRDRLYWLARRHAGRDRPHDLAAFDAVFAAVFDDADVVARPARPPRTARRRRRRPARSRWPPPAPTRSTGATDSRGTPCPRRSSGARTTAERTTGSSPSGCPATSWPDRRHPLRAARRRGAGPPRRWLETAFREWPTPPHAARGAPPSGPRIDPRQTIARSRRTGWEPIELVRRRRVERPRRLLVVCDVSQSMQAHATAYLHLMRAAVHATDAEMFAFSTSLTRLTPALAHREVDVAMGLASAAVDDRFGGTRIATNLRALLASRHGHDTRGGDRGDRLRRLGRATHPRHWPRRWPASGAGLTASCGSTLGPAPPATSRASPRWPPRSRSSTTCSRRRRCRTSSRPSSASQG